MERDIENNLFVEYVYIDGHYFGTSVNSIHSVMRSGLTCLLDLDPQVYIRTPALTLCWCSLYTYIPLYHSSGYKDGPDSGANAFHSLLSSSFSQPHETALGAQWNDKGTVNYVFQSMASL